MRTKGMSARIISPITSDQPKPGKGGKRKRVSEQTRQDIIDTAIINPQLSINDIAKINDLSPAFVHVLLKEHNVTRADVDDYKANEAILLAALRMRIYKSVSDEDIKKTPFVQRMTALGIAFDKNQLLEGKSTENINILVASIGELKKRKVEGSKSQDVIDVT